MLSEIDFLSFSWAQGALVPIWMAVACFVAAYVRSFSGFGFALLAVPFFLLALPPAQAIPLSIFLDLVIGVVLFPSLLKSGAIAWGSIRVLLFTALPFIPLGLLFAKSVSLTVLQLLIGIVLLASSILLIKGFRLQKTPSLPLTLATGAASGFLGGIAGMFGPPIILFYLSTPLGRTVSRASMMAFFVVLLVIAFALQSATAESLVWLQPLPFLLPFVLAGTYLGHKKFIAADETTFRRAVYILLLLLACSLIGKAVL